MLALHNPETEKLEGNMTNEITDPAQRDALLWLVVRAMIRNYGRGWRDHMDRIQCEGVNELLAPLGSFDDWATRALDEAEEARRAGDRYTEIERMWVFGEIVSRTDVDFHRSA